MQIIIIIIRIMIIIWSINTGSAVVSHPRCSEGHIRKEHALHIVAHEGKSDNVCCDKIVVPGCDGEPASRENCTTCKYAYASATGLCRGCDPTNGRLLCVLEPCNWAVILLLPFILLLIREYKP